ncbi:MAG: cytochrome c oxidase assembly factor Coa1 family protein [Bdellovibrionota bacterium]
MIKFNKKTIITAITLGVILYIGGYFLLSSGEAYKTAESYIWNNNELAGIIGPVTSVNLAFFGGSSKRTGEVNYLLNATGEKKRGTVNVKVVNENSIWKVVSATLMTHDNQTIELRTSQRN